MPARLDKVFAHAYCIWKRIRLLGKRRENEIAERVVVEIVETMPERLGKDALVVCRHRTNALAYIARGRHAAALAQNARRAAIVDHCHNRCHIASHIEKRAYGNGRTRAPANNNSLRSIHCRSPSLSIKRVALQLRLTAKTRRLQKPSGLISPLPAQGHGA